MSFWKSLFGNQGNAKQGITVIPTIRNHLNAMHQHFRSSRTYQTSAPYWRKLDSPRVQDWLDRTFNNARTRREVHTETMQIEDCLLIATVVPWAEAAQIRAVFEPSGYLNYLEDKGFFNAPRQRNSAAAFVLGHYGDAIRVDFSWLPPLDGNSYQIVIAQDILSPAERRRLGL